MSGPSVAGATLSPFVLALTFLMAGVSGVLADTREAIEAPEPVQVLLQGNDPALLREALLSRGGRVTHELPIIQGIGGVIDPRQLTALEQMPAISRLTEDFNPPKLPDTRDCLIAGDLHIELRDEALDWRIHNFSEQDLSLTWIDANWPGQLGTASVSFPTSDTVVSEAANHPIEPGQRRALNRVIPPGPSLMSIVFTQSTEGFDQNDFKITLGLASCETSLVPAYAANSQDYYFPAEAGATLLTDAGITGLGVGVAIIDSGLWDTPALTRNARGEARVAQHFNAISNIEGAALKDPGGHGSHMASIIANSGRVSRPHGNGYLGIAPNASLIPVTAISPRGDGDFMDIIRGIQWVIVNREALNIRVLNLSLTATPQVAYWMDPMNQAVLKAWEAGIAVVVAAGNDGEQWGTIGSPGNNPYVITVGAFTDSWTPNDRRDDYIPEFSSRGPTPEGFIKPDLIAPGGHITGLIPHDSNLARENPNYFLPNGEFVSTGSSQAAAVVSGLIALLLEVKPELTNDEVKCLLTTSAEPALSRDGRLAYSPFVQGAGRVNGSRALTVGNTQCDQQKLDIRAAVSGEETLYGPALTEQDGSPTLPGLANMVQSTPTAAGFSDDRRWGVAAHLERLDAETELPQADFVPFDWAAVFLLEQQKLKALGPAAPAD